MSQFDTSDSSVTIETLSDTNVVEPATPLSQTSSQIDVDSYSIGSLLVGFDYFFYTWTLLLASLIAYIAFYKYHEYEQMLKRKALLSRQHTLTRQQLLHQQQQLQLQQLKQPLLVKLFNLLLDVFYYLVLRLYDFCKYKLSAHIFIDTQTNNANNSQINSSGGNGGPNNPSNGLTSHANNFFSSTSSSSQSQPFSFRNMANSMAGSLSGGVGGSGGGGENLQDQLFCLNNCFKWFYFSGETTRRINTTILNSLNTQAANNSSQKNASLSVLLR